MVGFMLGSLVLERALALTVLICVVIYWHAPVRVRDTLIPRMKEASGCLRESGSSPPLFRAKVIVNFEQLPVFAAAKGEKERERESKRDHAIFIHTRTSLSDAASSHRRDQNH